MLLTYILIGIALAVPEITFVEKTPWLKRWVQKDARLEWVFSTVISIVIATVLLIPQGVTIAIGNVFGTVITVMWYKIDPMTKWKNMKSEVQNTWSKVKSIVNLFHFIFLPFTTIVKGLERVNLYLRRTK